MKNFNRRYMLVLISLCGIIAASGGLTVNVAGLFYSPVSSELGVGRGSVALGMTICTMVGSFAGLAVGKVVRTDNFKRSVLLWTAANAAATLGLAFCGSVVPIYLLNAVRGVATGFVGMVLATMMVNNWYRANTGLFTSIVMGFSGVSSALFSPIISSVIQSQGWRAGYMLTAALMALFCVPAAVFPLTLRPEDAGMEPYGAGPGAAETKAEASETVTVSASGLAPVMIYSMLTGLIVTIVQHLPGIADTYMLAASVGAAMLSAGMISNTGGKVLIGIMIDRIGTRLSIFIMSAVTALGFLSVLFVRNGAGMIAGALLIGFGYSLNTVGIVMTVRDCFGQSGYPKVYPKANLCMTMTYAIGSTVVGYVYDFFGSYTPVLWAMLAALAGALVCTVISYSKR